jgi:hypothetical protein
LVGYILHIELYSMQKLLKFSSFQTNKELLETTNPDIVNETESLKSESQILDEGILDIGGLLSKASSAIFGSFSRAGQVDELRKVILTAEIAIVQDGYELEDELDKLRDDLSAAKKSKDDAKIKSLSDKITLKSKEQQEMLAAHKAKIRRAEDVLDKVVAKSERLKKYYEAGRSEDLFDLAQIKYKMAKDRSESSEKIFRAKEEMDSAKKEAEAASREKKEMLDKEKSDKEKSPKEDPKKSGGESKTEVEAPKPRKRKKADSSEEKKIVSSRKASTIIQHKKDLAIEIADLKYDLEEFLEKVRKKIAKDPKAISQKVMDRMQMDALEIASNLDSKQNLLDLYKTMGKTQSEIAKTSAKESKITEISNRINQAIADGNDSSSGTKKTISDAFREGISMEKLQKAIQEISKI